MKSLLLDFGRRGWGEVLELCWALALGSIANLLPGGKGLEVAGAICEQIADVRDRQQTGRLG